MKDPAKVSDSIAVLKSYNHQLSGQVEQMERQVKEIKEKIKKVYGVKDM